MTVSFLVLAFSGFEILMVHPRLYWGEVGNDLTPALFELPISRNYKHGGWEKSKPFLEVTRSSISASRTYEIFNKNGWGRSLHFLAAWFIVLTGLVYLFAGIFTGHFKRNIWPKIKELSPKLFWRDFVNHLRMQIPLATIRLAIRSPSEMHLYHGYIPCFALSSNYRLYDVPSYYRSISNSLRNFWWIPICQYLCHSNCPATIRQMV